MSHSDCKNSSKSFFFPSKLFRTVSKQYKKKTPLLPSLCVNTSNNTISLLLQRAKIEKQSRQDEQAANLFQEKSQREKITAVKSYSPVVHDFRFHTFIRKRKRSYFLSNIFQTSQISSFDNQKEIKNESTPTEIKREKTFLPPNIKIVIKPFANLK
eukprot:TRINITY_DN5273_c0_g1_i1.p3 TRINITY_DN5273_c0_g1~~TRINITY_DN5273_c0_g1_i1.p3  ORF type:complete len:156 (-),score=18.93 TRINITY_DN5273_c0_g1_i1:184-651(-)